MIELTESEIHDISGAFAPILAVPVVIGAITGGAAGAIQSNGNIGETILGASLGASAGFFGTIAGATTGAVRLLYGSYAVAAGVATTWNDS
jgi:hypothetical protein